MGLHTRPAAAIVKMLQNSKCSVSFVHKRATINAKSILSILMLAAQRNASITIVVEGEDAHPTMEKLIEGFANKFGEL